MATWNSRGLRGSTLEEFINHTNTRYSEMGLALIQKIPTPITPVRIDKEHRHITLAYFDKISTVDISVPCRAFRSALMQKNVMLIHFHFRMSMNIRSVLWKNLSSREESHFS